MITKKLKISFLLIFICSIAISQDILYTMPEETELHEGTWLQWPHNKLYGPYYKSDVEPTWIAMTDALQTGENVHIIAYDSTELALIINSLTTENIPLINIDFYVHENDDVWIRDNGPMFVFDEDENLSILDWGFNGWGNDTPFLKSDQIPELLSSDLMLPIVDLNAMVLEGGAIEHDGNGTMLATRSSVTHPSRNPNLTESEIENYLTTYVGITNFIWLDGIYGLEITDMHIDGFAKFLNDSTIITMNNDDLIYWEVPANDINTLYNAQNNHGKSYQYVFLPLTENNVVTTYGNNLGYKGSYVNFYIGNEVILVPTYNDPNDEVAIEIIQDLYPNRIAVGIDCRNLYEYGGMIHCVTQQQPAATHTSICKVLKNKQSLLNIFPNPCKGSTAISIDSSVKNGEIIIYNNLGAKMEIIQQDKGFNTCFSIENYPCGLYYILLINDKQIIETKAFVVEN